MFDQLFLPTLPGFIRRRLTLIHHVILVRSAIIWMPERLSIGNPFGQDIQFPRATGERVGGPVWSVLAIFRLKIPNTLLDCFEN